MGQIGMKAHFGMLAAYNAWANRRLLDAAKALPPDRLDEDQGAAFGSVLGTLNHMLVADLIWLARFDEAPSPGLALDQRLYDRLDGLTTARTDLDQRIVAHVDGLSDARIDGEFSYRTVAGEPFRQPRATVLAHFFNHQTHHRGQIHALLTRLTGEAPPLDLIYLQRAA